jgi:hypothetical protein
MKTLAVGEYRRSVPDLWFVVGVAVGTIVTGFCAIGSFDRGSDSVRRRSWSLEHAARKRALFASPTVGHVVAQPTADGALPKAS